jgi:hypothetical protein
MYMGQNCGTVAATDRPFLEHRGMNTQRTLLRFKYAAWLRAIGYDKAKKSREMEHREYIARHVVSDSTARNQ